MSLAMNAALQGYLGLSTTQLLIKTMVAAQPNLEADDIACALATAFETGWKYQGAITPGPERMQ